MTDMQLLDSVAHFAARELAPQAAQVDRNGAFPAGRWEQMADFGLMGLVIPPDYGGLAVGPADFAEVLGRISGACASTAWGLLTHSAAAAIVAANGTEGQKLRYLPDLAAGRLQGAVAVTETGGGSNPGSIRTVARATAGGYELNGAKFFISRAGVANLYLIMARTTDISGAEGLSGFLLHKDDPGITFGKREETLGLRGIEVHEIFLDHCHVPADRLVGQLGAGRAIMGSISGTILIGASAAALGIAQVAYAAACQHVKTRTVLGKPLIDAAGVQSTIGALTLELEGAQAWLQHALNGLQEGRDTPPRRLWMAKLAITRATVLIADQCLALHGAVGYSRALPLERYVRDARAFCVHWGNNDVLLDRIAKTAIGPA